MPARHMNKHELFNFVHESVRYPTPSGWQSINKTNNLFPYNHLNKMAYY
jgi:hypothetical protein